MSGRQVIFSIVGAAVAFGILMFLVRSGTLHEWISHLFPQAQQKRSAVHGNSLARSGAPNQSLQPTVHAFGAPVGANGVHFPRHAARWLGAAELQRWAS